MKVKKSAVLFMALMLLACNRSKNVFMESFRMVVTNPLAIDRHDAVVRLCIKSILKKHPDFNVNAFAVFSNGDEIPSQAVDPNQDGTADEIITVLDLSGDESRTLEVRYAKSGEIQLQYPKRTQAELSHKVGGRFVDRQYEGGSFQNVDFLRVPPEHTDHSWFIRYEGPGWESDKVGYRFYLDWRNAVDIYGKKVTGMVLQDVGQDGFESYHEMSDWGMDILKVGESLGLGSLGMWDSEQAVRVAETDSILCAIVENGPVYSQIRTRYFGWKVGFPSYDLISDLSIVAGSRMTKHEVQISGPASNLCTGIVKHDSAEVLKVTGNSWEAFATWGKQSLADDDLGMAVLYRSADLDKITEDAHSHVIVLRPEDGTLTYRFLAAWEKEPQGITSKEAFVRYLEETIQRLESPVVIEPASDRSDIRPQERSD